MLCGKSGSGKDTFYKQLSELMKSWNKYNTCNLVRLSVGDHVKLLATKFGWDGVKDEKGVDLLQKVGEKYNRICTDRAVEDATLFMSLEGVWNYVITDHRYPYEHEMFKFLCKKRNLDYYRIRLIREDFTNYTKGDFRAGHKSENLMNDFEVDATIYNKENEPFQMIKQFIEIVGLEEPK